MTFYDLSLIAACLALGGLIKGATGAGAPIFAVPALAALFDVPFAIAIMVIPNLVSNCWQIWQQRAHRPGNWFLWSFIGAGALGVAVGTWILTALPSETLLIGIAMTVLLYLALRLWKPHWQLSQAIADRLSLPAGVLAGMLQGATGISAPVSISFLNAIRLPRPVFIFTISSLFVTFLVVQIPALSIAGILTWERAGLSLFAMIPLLGAMPVGSFIAKKMPATAFDKLILLLLGALALKLFYDALF